MSEWIEYDGTGAPVAPSQLVIVRFADETREKATRMGAYPASEIGWHVGFNPPIEYRPSKANGDKDE